ncbi:DJ-1/PfpI family protein [Streptomyces sp. SID8361]|uniref:DJ-1/PfpI family protein n=1 Tax=Streptomyces sp. MnatMP-M27 TaxID=1839768 RepID=UPI00081DDAB6|nr:DJ-1/PfpI family protein [Streptomyces sp. MnatMP-M27]MYU12459.1 DJ-1/PfpI family protein [Streptomyces sp. SID8361]SCF91810.1 cyclohexyl-isocyanide hydratase [Streptomyces sp. MnatMP-M27]
MTDQTTNWPDHLTGDAQPLEVGILLYEGHTALDLVGPYTTFALAGMKVHLVAETLNPVVSDDGGMTIAPTTTFDDCPERLDILFVPGGGMVDKPMLDPATIAWLADRGATASYITAVCNGPLVLAAAGLLDGYRVATHWASRDQLARLGVEVSTERVCIDRNRFSGGGVTAGIDFGLTVVAHTLGQKAARFAQLVMEYDPEPPFNAGSPESAGPEIVALRTRFMAEPDTALRNAVSHVLEQRAATSSHPASDENGDPAAGIVDN